VVGRQILGLQTYFKRAGYRAACGYVYNTANVIECDVNISLALSILLEVEGENHGY
jgi:hypothetical protein